MEHKRFSVTTTPFALITWAYGYNKNGGCTFVSVGDFLTGGPDWIRSEKFDIRALMPDGSPDYNTTEFLNGKAPVLERMIARMLADRFGLVVHKETKEAGRSLRRRRATSRLPGDRERLRRRTSAQERR